MWAGTLIAPVSRELILKCVTENLSPEQEQQPDSCIHLEIPPNLKSLQDHSVAAIQFTQEHHSIS